MQQIEQHKITKIINKSGVTRDYYNQHNTHYHNISLVLENNPKFTIFDKRNGQVLKHQNRPLTTIPQPKEMICY